MNKLTRLFHDKEFRETFLFSVIIGFILFIMLANLGAAIINLIIAGDLYG